MQQAQVSSAGTPAPYGRACTNCSRAKCKCIYRRDGGRCERCHRLDKDCAPSVPVRRRNVKKPSASKTAQLEEKLDDLVALLRAQAVAKTAQSTEGASLPSGPSPSGPENLNSGQRSIAETSPSSHHPSTVSNDTTTSTIECYRPPSSSYQLQWGTLLDSDIPEYAAEQNLALFRTCMLRYFPFVFIAPHITAAELRQRRPFLWFCIMTNTTKSLQQQVLMVQQVRNAVAQKVIIEGEKSMDILLGLICHLAWSHYFKAFNKDRPYLPLWTQMAIAMIYDLGLHKSSPHQTQPITFKSFWFGPPKTQPPVLECGMEGRRALVSAFIMSCVLMTVLRKGNIMRWTPHMEDSVRVLWEHPECEGDKVLAVQTRCYLVTSQLVSSHYYAGECEDPRPPPAYFTKSLLSQLQDIKRSITPDLKQNQIVLMFLHSTELWIREVEVFHPPQKSNEISEHLTNLWACVQSIREWLDVYFEAPISSNLGMTFNIFAQASHCIITLYRLSTVEDPTWDKSLLRKDLDVVAIIERFADVMDEVTGAMGLVSDPDVADATIFTKVSRLMRQMATKWRGEIGGEQATAGPEGQAGQPATLVGDTITDDMALDFTIDPWLSDLFSSWEPQE